MVTRKSYALVTRWVTEDSGRQEVKAADEPGSCCQVRLTEGQGDILHSQTLLARVNSILRLVRRRKKVNTKIPLTKDDDTNHRSTLVLRSMVRTPFIKHYKLINVHHFLYTNQVYQFKKVPLEIRFYLKHTVIRIAS